jgi:protein TonB
MDSERDSQSAARQELDQAERWLESDPRDRRALAWALGIALALHGVLLVARVPHWGFAPQRVDAPREVAMKVQFLQPPPPPQPPKPEPPKPATKKIPRPDRTPDEPEPKVEPTPAPPESAQGPATGQAMGPVRVSPGEGPGLIKRVEPIYPPIARASRLQGTVVLDAVILRDGSVSEVRVTKSGNPIFDKAAVDALRQWRFTPGDRDVIMSLTVHFQIAR